MEYIYDINHFIRCDDDRDVVIAILALDVNISENEIRERLYKDYSLTHEAIDNVLPMVERIHGIAYNIRVLLCTRGNIIITKGL